MGAILLDTISRTIGGTILGGTDPGDTTPPTVIFEAIDETTIRGTFNEPTTPSLLGYSFKKNGSGLSLDAVAEISSSVWDFSVGVMTSDDVIQSSYDPSTGDTQDDNGNELASFTDVAVENSVAPEHPFNTATNNKIVKPGGTPGVDCDYENIDDAYAAITTASSGNQFTMKPQDGLNETFGVEFTPGSGIWQGLIPKDYVHIVGQSKAGTIIKGQLAASANESLCDTFHYPATFLIKNLTVKSENVKYPFHFDTNLFEYLFYGIDLIVENEGSATQGGYNLGFGMHGGQKFVFRRCDFINPAGVFGHNNQVNTRDLSKHFEIEFIDCTMDLFEYHDFIEYSPNKITLTRCNIGEVVLNMYTDNYDAHPGSPTDNNGTKPFTEIIASGNIVGSVSRNAEAAASLGSSFSSPSDFL